MLALVCSTLIGFVQTADVTVELPEAIVFRPTMKEFENPMKYIASIVDKATPYGIAKIIPPLGWKSPCGLGQESRDKSFFTRKQSLHKLTQGEPFPDGRSYVLSEYQKMADDFKRQFPELSTSPDNLTAARHEQGLADSAPRSSFEILASRAEKVYWDAVENGRRDITVEYGNDQDTETYGSGFLKRQIQLEHEATQRKVGVGGNQGTTLEARDYAVVGHKNRGTVEENELSSGLKSSLLPDFANREYYRECGWNLNNMPHLPSSLLRLVPEAVGGINVPWLYMGMLFSTFCWHVEDNYLYSINYMHHGEAKLWYGVSGDQAEAFESLMKRHLHGKFKSEPDLLFHLTTMISPATLARSGVQAVRTVQHPGEFIITMPRAYHGGFSLGFNIAEACNFALAQWIPWGRKAVDVYRSAAVPRPAVFCHEKLMLDLARFATSDRSEFSAVDLRIILAEVQQILRLEVRDRKRLEADGFVEGTRFYVRNDGDARHECIKCRRACYLSAVLCKGCGSKQMCCPRHHRSLCGCAPGMRGKLLLYWHTAKSISELAEGLRMKVDAVSSGAASPYRDQVTPPQAAM